MDMDAGPSCYRCTFQGCLKTFTRKDHLLRHAANHSSETHHCARCGRPFKRLDLLQRHEKRNICGPEENDALDQRVLEHNASPSKRRRTSDSDDLAIRPISAISISRPTSSTYANTTPSHLNTSTPLLNSQSGFPNTHNVSANGDANGNSSVDFPFDWGLGGFPPEQWEAFLHESLAPPFNQPVFVETPWDASQFPSMLQYQTTPQQMQFPPSTPFPIGQTITSHPRELPVAQPPPVANGQELTPSRVPEPELDQAEEKYEEEVITRSLMNRIRTSFPELDVSSSFANDAVSLYWRKTAPTFPFIHRGTFDLHLASDDLIVMMVIIGSIHISPRRDFSSLVQRIRGKLVQECSLEMPISALQAFCLCHVHDTWYSTAESLFVAQCMWPVMVAHSRKKGIGVAGRQDRDTQQEEAWSVWAKEEERRRAAYCVLLIDTQLSAFWNQHCSRQLSIFAHHLSLPCSKSQWEACTPAEWLQFRDKEESLTATRQELDTHVLDTKNGAKSNGSNTPSIKAKSAKSSYLPGLQPEFNVAAVAEGYSSAILITLQGQLNHPLTAGLESSLTTQMVLIGIIAIAWDCRTRGGMGIRFREGTKHWRSIVFTAVIKLRAAYESGVVHMSASAESRDLRDTFAICIISVFSDIPMLHVAAGATSFCGATIGPRQYADAKRRLKLWTKTEDAWTCVWQSVRYLRQSLFSEWGLYSSWAVFNTTLVVWGYAWTTALDTAPASLPPPHSKGAESHYYPDANHHPLSTSASVPDSMAPTPDERWPPMATVDRQRTINAWLDRVLSAQGKMVGQGQGLERDLANVIDYVAEKLISTHMTGPGTGDDSARSAADRALSGRSANGNNVPLKAGYGGQEIDRENGRLLKGLMRSHRF